MNEVVALFHWSFEEAVDLIFLADDVNLSIIRVIILLINLNFDLFKFMEDRLLNNLINSLSLLWARMYDRAISSLCVVSTLGL